jgi:hypothetical protein
MMVVAAHLVAVMHSGVVELGLVATDSHTEIELFHYTKKTAVRSH